MRDRLAHRGPDGAGTWTGSYSVGSVSMGFRRLAIIDTRHVADQPMVSQDGRKVIVFNGEIYNFVELRAELEAAGHAFRTRSDTEVLLQAYERWGDAMVERLNGMFAFMIWDAARGEALLARDRFGEKPLFMCALPGGRLAFASEIKALLAHPEVEIGYDLAMFSRVLGGHLIFGTEETLFRGVRQFRAGHRMVVGIDGRIVRDERYWRPAYDDALGSMDKSELIARFREHLERSVAMRMRSDVPVTACLSGGLDSSALVALLAASRNRQAGGIEGAISVRFPEDPTIDEGPFIDRVLQTTGLRGHAVTPTADELVRDIRRLHWHHETIIPGPSMFLEWSMMREARALGYKVIIDGQGADEVLAGYRSYLQAYQAELAHRGPAGLARALWLGWQRDRRLRRAAQLYVHAHRRFGLRDSLPLRDVIHYLKWLAALAREYGGDGLPEVKDIGALRFDLALNLMRTSLPSNLYSGDRNSMAHGIECRYPYLDYALVDFATHLPDWAYLEGGWGKAILRQALPDRLPHEVLWRPDKVGFAAPQDRWLAVPAMKAWIEERVLDALLVGVPGYDPRHMREMLASHAAGRADHSGLLWCWASAAELLDMQARNEWGGARTEWVSAAPAVTRPAGSGAEHGDYRLDVLQDGCRPGTSQGGRTAWIVSYTPVAKEPRVIRQAQALVDAGWRVFVFGYEGPTACPESWHFVQLPSHFPNKPRMSFAVRALHLLGLLVARFAPLGRLRQLGARFYHATIHRYRLNGAAIRKFFERRADARPDLVISHDYFTCDIGYQIASRCGARFAVDCHEYARGQYMHDPRWVRWNRHYVVAMQDYYLSRADAVTTVCEGIAKLLDAEQALRRPVRVVRSMPFFRPQPFRPTGETITVLYHGEIYRTRGLHHAVGSLHLWRPEFRLVLRGYSDPDYVAELERIARERGVLERLTIEPPVTFDQIVPAANRADIGFFVHEDTSPQRRFVLPNKFFEYVMAGLALCVSDLPEMARLVRQYDLGVLVPECEERAIADAINGLDRERIDAMKRKSIAAAAELNWETEQHQMLSLYEELFR
jgi:asparagine synthase (glutamine-hydrolysing)